MDDAPKWDVKECDCEEVGGSCLLGHDEILRLRAALDKAEGERDDVTQGLLDMLRRAQLAEAENARLRAIIQRGVNWLDGKGTKVGGLYSFDVQSAVASPTQPAPAGECQHTHLNPALRQVTCALCGAKPLETP